MSKTPYEIRLKLVEDAKDLLVHDWVEKKEAMLRVWDLKVSRLKKSESIPDFPKLPDFPTEAQIVAKATTLYAFVCDDTKSKK